MNNFRTLVYGSNVQPIIEDIKNHPEAWNQHTFRTTFNKGYPFKECDDIILQYNDLSQPEIDWLETVPFPMMYLMPAARRAAHALMGAVSGDRLGRVIIARLPPGGHIDAHPDSPHMCSYYNRYHICLEDNDKTEFRCGDEYFRPNVGDIFWFNNALEHEVWNNGTTDRLTLIIDIRKPTVLNFYGPNESPTPPAEKAERAPGINYQQETFAGILEELKEILPLHYEELAADQKDIPLDPDFDQYLNMERLKLLHVYTVRDGEKLIGYHIGFVSGHLHYKSTKFYITDVYYVLQEYRQQGLGYKFFKKFEEHLRALGVFKIICGCKVAKDHTQMFDALGYKHSDHTFTKVLRQ